MVHVTGNPVAALVTPVPDGLARGSQTSVLLEVALLFLTQWSRSDPSAGLMDFWGGKDRTTICVRHVQELYILRGLCCVCTTIACKCNRREAMGKSSPAAGISILPVDNPFTWGGGSTPLGRAFCAWQDSIQHLEYLSCL